MVRLEFNSVGRPANLTTEHATETIKDLLEYVKKNEYNSELVRAANTLPQIEKTILVMYLHNNLNLTKTAKELHSSTQFLKKRLTAIFEMVRGEVDSELLEEELEKIHIV